jgi:hypothetical protein
MITLKELADLLPNWECDVKDACLYHRADRHRLYQVMTNWVSAMGLLESLCRPVNECGMGWVYMIKRRPTHYVVEIKAASKTRQIRRSGESNRFEEAIMLAIAKTAAAEMDKEIWGF